MITRRFRVSRFPRPGKLADRDFRLGINGNSQDVLLSLRLPRDGFNILKDQIGFGIFFTGVVF